MKILVTGGAGFIGSNFIRLLLKKRKSDSIICLDKLSYAGHIENLSGLEKQYANFIFIKGDICNRKDYEDIKPQIVVNFAAESHVDRSLLVSEDFWKTNVEGSKTLLEYAKDCKTQLFVQISTDEVYGSVEQGYSREGSPLNPTSPYAQSKAEADKIAKEFSGYFRVIITRSCNNLGPYQHPEKIVPLFITNALENKVLPIYGDGQNIREWIYVWDNCRAIDFVMDRAKEALNIYNIGTGNHISNFELTKRILKRLNKPESLIQFIKDRPNHDRRYALDSEKIKTLGWKPENDIDSALEKTIDWYIENQNWWKNIKKQEEFVSFYKKQYGV